MKVFRTFSENKLQYNFTKTRWGIEGHLEFFRKFIWFGSVTHPQPWVTLPTLQTTLVFLVTTFILCPNSTITSFSGDTFSLSLNLRNITLHQFRRHRHAASFKSLCLPSGLLQVLKLTLHALKNALLLRWHVPFKLTTLKHNQVAVKHHATAVPPPQKFLPFLTMLVRFLTALCTP